MLVAPLLLALAIKTASTTVQGREIQSAIEETFEPRDVPNFLAISFCESGMRQWDSAGNLIISSTSDSGALQVNSIHNKEAKALGIDFRASIEDNIKMAKTIFDSQGYKAWLTCSKKLDLI